MSHDEQKPANYLLVEDLAEGGLEVWFRRKQIEFFLSQSALQLRAMPAPAVEGTTAIVLGLSHSRDTLAALALIRSSRSLRALPVVAVVPPGAPPNVTQSLRRLGVFLCLERPLLGDVLEGALSAAQTYRAVVVSSMRPAAPTVQPWGQLLREGTFRIRTPDEASALSEMLAMACPDPGRQMCGIHELLMNGIEHGNLGVDHSAKAGFLREGAWHTELNRRLNLPEHKDKVVTVSFRRGDDVIMLRVRDQGGGFDWKKALGATVDAASGPNGRGIMLARMLSFDQLDYRDPGNEAIARIRLKQRARTETQELVLTEAMARASQPPRRDSRISGAPLPHEERPASVHSPASESEQLFALSQDAMLIHDGLIRRVNPAFTRLLGWTNEEAIERPVIDFIDPEDRQRISDEYIQLRAAAPGEMRSPQIMRVLLKSGGSRPIEWSNVLGEDGRVYAVGRDVSAMKQALDTLGVQNEEMRRLHDVIRREQQLAGQVLANIRRQGCMDAPGIRYTSSGLEFFNGDITLAASTPAGELRWLLGDFTGHGLCAAIGTTPVAGAFYATTKKAIPLVEVVATINDSLKNLMPAGLFCAAGFLALSPDSRKLWIWNGGLPAVLMRRARTGAVERFNSNALPLGLVKSQELGVSLVEVAVEHGDEVFVYSDGLTEAANADGELFGIDRLEQALHAAPKQGVFEWLLAEVANFRGSTEVSDDVSLVGVTIGETTQPQVARVSTPAARRPQARPSQAPSRS